jgi:heme exporter protein C
MSLKAIRLSALLFGFFGVGLTLLFHWMVFFWVSTEATLGISQRIFYIHVAAMWNGLLAFIVVALCSAMYLWLRDDRLDQIGRSAAEGGLVFFAIGLVSGPLWARLAWGTWWTWEPRLTLSLLAFFIYIGYLLVRGATENPERGKRFAAVIGVVGAINIPLIHVSVLWFRSLHPQPVVARQDGPALPADMLITLMTALLAWTVLLFALVLLRYGAAQLEAKAEELALRKGAVT